MGGLIVSFGCCCCSLVVFVVNVMMYIHKRSMKFASTHIYMSLNANSACGTFLYLNSVCLQSFRFGPEIAYVASCVLDVLKGVRNKTLVGGANKGRCYTLKFLLEVYLIVVFICMISSPTEPTSQVVLARMFLCCCHRYECLI